MEFMTAQDMTALQRLKKRQDELHVTAKKSLGQNFLVSDSVISKILKTALEFKPQKVVEIGPGCGALTDLLLQEFKDFQVIELDHVLAEFWRSQNIQVVEEDALRINWESFAGSLLVSNLPYQISSSLVIDRSLDVPPLQGMILMFQKEVAQRIRAVPKTEHYGMLSVIAQEFWSVETICDAGPVDFRPQPKVASRVLKFMPRESSITDRKHYLAFLKIAFQQRRRILKTNLQALQGLPWINFSVERVSDWFVKNKKSDKVRAEELSPTEFQQFYDFLKR